MTEKKDNQNKNNCLEIKNKEVHSNKETRAHISSCTSGSHIPSGSYLGRRKCSIDVREENL